MVLFRHRLAAAEGARENIVALVGLEKLSSGNLERVVQLRAARVVVLRRLGIGLAERKLVVVLR